MIYIVFFIDKLGLKFKYKHWFEIVTGIVKMLWMLGSMASQSWKEKRISLLKYRQCDACTINFKCNAHRKYI